MLRIGRPDLHAHGAVPRSHQIAVVGESRAEEGLTVHVVGTDFQAEPAFQTFGHGVLMGMVFHDLCQECCNLETFFDLKGEISDDEDEEWDDDDGDFVFITRPEE